MTARPKREGVMLAVPADEKKIAKLGQNFLIQPKLDGERCVVDIFHGEPVLLSSYKNPFEFIDHLRDRIKSVWNAFGTPIPFDGEIYVHGWSRERIDSALRRTVNYNPEVEKLEFHIFDLKLPIPQGQRLYLLDQVFLTIQENPKIAQFLKQVPTFRTTKETWMLGADSFLAEGYEGAMLRNPHFPAYKPRRLVNQLLKYKPTEIDEYEILGVEEAISKEGIPKGMVGSFLVQGNDGVPFSVGAGKLSHDKRRHYWTIQNTIIGKTLITKQGKIKTTNGVPTCAVAVEIKED